MIRICHPLSAAPMELRSILRKIGTVLTCVEKTRIEMNQTTNTVTYSISLYIYIIISICINHYQCIYKYICVCVCLYITHEHTFEIHWSPTAFSVLAARLCLQIYLKKTDKNAPSACISIKWKLRKENICLTFNVGGQPILSLWRFPFGTELQIGYLVLGLHTIQQSIT